MKVLEKAVELIGRGFSVFPCIAGTKVPATPQGFLNSTKDPEVARTMFTNGQNIGVYPGESDIVVIDFDLYKPEDLSYLWNELGPLPPTYTVRTPRGGRHFYFRNRTGRDLRSYNGQIAKTVDLRGTGGYVLAEGSVVYGEGEYVCVDGSPIADLPEAWARRWESLNIPRSKTYADFAKDPRVRSFQKIPGVGLQVVLADGWLSRSLGDQNVISAPTLKELTAAMADVRLV